MQITSFPLLATAMVGLFLSSCGSQAPPTPSASPAADGNSPAAATTSDGSQTPFHRVMGRLDVGGKMLEIEDHDGRREMVLGLAEMILSTSLAEMPRDKLDMPALLDAFGIGRSAASGRSIRKDDDAWLFKNYTYQPKGRKGFETLLGNASAPFLAAETLPATVDLVIEARLDISAFPAMMTEIARAVGQEEAATGFLKQDLPSGGALLDLLGQSKLHLIAGLEVSSRGQAEEERKHLDFFIRVDGGKAILQSLQPQITQALGEPEMVGKVRLWRVGLSGLGLEPALVVPDPVFLLADEDGTLTLASTRPYLEAARGTGSKLAADPSYLASTNHFPKSGNLLVYASPEFPPLLAYLLKDTVVPQAQGELAPLLAKATDYLAPRPWSLCLAYETDGSMITSEIPFPGYTDIAASLPLLSATSVLFIGSRSWKDGSDRAGCILNIRNVQIAVRSYANLNGLEEGADIPWDKIFGPNAFLPEKPVCPTGGTYSFAAKVPKVGELACRCSHAEHAPPEHANW